MSQRGDHIFVTTESQVNQGDALIISNDQNGIIIDNGNDDQFIQFGQDNLVKIKLRSTKLEISRNGNPSSLTVRESGDTELWGNVQFNKHLTTSSQANMNVSSVGAVSCTINSKIGNDIRGVIEFTPSTTGTSQIKITFNNPFQTIPVVIITPINGDTSITNMFVIDTQLDYVIIALNVLVSGTIHRFNYFVIG
jgi:hypothetical protein